MIEQQRQRIEQEMTQLVDNLDRTHLRKMQVNIQIRNNLNVQQFFKLSIRICYWMLMCFLILGRHAFMCFKLLSGLYQLYGCCSRLCRKM